MLPLILCRYCYTSTDACSIHADLFQTHTAVLWTALLLKKVEPGHAGDAAAGCGGFWGWSRGAVATVVRFHGIQELGGAVAVQAKSGGLWQGILCQWGAVTTQGILCQRGAVTTPGILCQRWAVTRHYVSVTVRGGLWQQGILCEWGAVTTQGILCQWVVVTTQGILCQWGAVTTQGILCQRGAVTTPGILCQRGAVTTQGILCQRGAVTTQGILCQRGAVTTQGILCQRGAVTTQDILCQRRAVTRHSVSVGGCDNKTFCVTGGLWHSILCHKVQPQPHTKHKLLLPMTPLDIFETRVTSIAWQKWFTETCQIHGPTQLYQQTSSSLPHRRHTHTHKHTHAICTLTVLFKNIPSTSKTHTYTQTHTRHMHSHCAF